MSKQASLLMSKQATLLREKEQMLEKLANVIGCYTSYFSNLLGKSEETHKNCEEKRHYPFIPAGASLNSIRCFAALKEYFEKANPYDRKTSDKRRYIVRGPSDARYVPRFVDCGGGVGNVALLASMVGFKSSIIEYNSESCKIAKVLCSGYDVTVEQGDITTYKNYADFDLIYFYIPMCSEEHMQKFVRKIMKHTKIGAVILSYAGYTCGGMLMDEKNKRFKMFKLPNGVAPVGRSVIKVKN